MNKVQAIRKVESLQENENNIIVVALPKTLYCEACKEWHPYNDIEWIPIYNINACIACRVLIARVERAEIMEV